MHNRDFPKDFYFGAATSSHQVEGNTHNDWTEWEKKNADRLAREAEKNPPPIQEASGSWPEFILNTYPNPLERSNYISDIAADHYNRFEEDFDLAKKLGHNAHRFSIEWSRIEPHEGVFVEKEIAHYRQVILALRKRKMEPFVTLWHWTLPVWLAKQGGVGSRDFPRYFARYAETVVKELARDAHFFFTINEPEVYSLHAYFRKRWPPQKSGAFSFYRSFSHLITAHRAAYRTIKSVAPTATVGVVCNLSDFKSSGGPINTMLKVLYERFWNHYFLRRVRDEVDCIGLNFYFHNRINYGLNKNTYEKVSDVGWDLHPEGITPVLLSLNQYEKPIYITESGLADARDIHRPWFIKETLRAIRRAMEEGIDVRGYLHWSLLDNFEWDKGFWPRFGLIAVDYRNLKRTIRPSASVYKKIIAHGLDA